MNTPSRSGLGLVLLLAGVTSVPAAIINLSSGDTPMASHAGNLILNGSFENSGWAPLASPTTPQPTGNLRWLPAGTGSTQYGPIYVPANWTTGGGTDNYAFWGSDTVSPGSGLRGSDALPDGSLGFYMGNQATFVSPSPSFANDGVITFSSTPIFTHQAGAPYLPAVFIQQTVTGLSPGSDYLLDFWVSGEDAATSGFAAPGLLQLDISGEAGPIFVAAPYSPSDANLGASQRYFVQFQPAASTVTFTFTNHGHLLDTGIGTEAVLDDVILNLVPASSEVPEPATVSVGLAISGLVGWRCLRNWKARARRA